MAAHSIAQTLFYICFLYINELCNIDERKQILILNYEKFKKNRDDKMETLKFRFLMHSNF